MRQILINAIVICFVLSFIECQNNSNIKTYGEEFESVNPIVVSTIPSVMSKIDSLPGVFQGTIEASCKMKGCWMTLQSETGDEFRVTFQDYGFFVPKEGLNGKNTTINGYCIRTTTSVAEQKHYAEDAGKTEDEIAMITEPVQEFAFVASGVKIEE